MNWKAVRAAMILLGGFTILSMAGCGGCYGCSRIHVSDGYRDGTIRKLSHSGIVFKTWELEMLGDGMKTVGTGDQRSLHVETFEYSLSDLDLVKQVSDLGVNKVRVHYRKQLMPWFPSGESRYFATKVEPLK